MGHDVNLFPTNLMQPVIGFIGRKAIASVNHILNLFCVNLSHFRHRTGSPRAGPQTVRRVVVQQLYLPRSQALPILIPIALLVGAMTIIQFAKISRPV